MLDHLHLKIHFDNLIHLNDVNCRITHAVPEQLSLHHLVLSSVLTIVKMIFSDMRSVSGRFIDLFEYQGACVERVAY